MNPVSLNEFYARREKHGSISEQGHFAGSMIDEPFTDSCNPHTNIFDAKIFKRAFIEAQGRADA